MLSHMACGRPHGAKAKPHRAPWWKKDLVTVPVSRSAPPRVLVDIFLTDIEFPFETAFWNQPAKLVDRSPQPSGAPGLDIPGMPDSAIILAEASLQELIDGFSDISPVDRPHCVVLLADGQCLCAAEIEGLMDDLHPVEG